MVKPFGYRAANLALFIMAASSRVYPVAMHRAFRYQMTSPISFRTF